MAHAKLVPNVGVVQCQVCQHQIGCQQFLEHVGTEVACALLVVGAEHVEAGQFECGPKQLGVDAVEVDRLAVGGGFGAEGGYEGVRGHDFLGGETRVWLGC